MNNFNQRIPKNPNIVDIENAEELSFWARKFKISEQKLIRIVKKVGSEKEKVEASLKKERAQQYSWGYEK